MLPGSSKPCNQFCAKMSVRPFKLSLTRWSSTVSEFIFVPHLAKLDQISKQCVYQGSQVSSPGRVSLTCTDFNLN